MPDPNNVFSQFAEIPEDTEIDGLKVRAILVLTSIKDEEIVEDIVLWLAKPDTPDGKTDERRSALAVAPRHRNSLMIEDVAIFAVLLKAGVVTVPYLWEKMQPVCKMLDFESAI
jgi:hypothetical protein